MQTLRAVSANTQATITQSTTLRHLTSDGADDNDDDIIADTHLTDDAHNTNLQHNGQL
jgi:hypothetical protein